MVTYNAERWNYYPTTGTTGGTDGGGDGDPLPEEPFEPNPYDPGGNLYNFIQSGTTKSYGAYLGWSGDSRLKNSFGQLPPAPDPNVPDPDSTFLDNGSVNVGGQDYASHFAYQQWSTGAKQLIRTGVNYVFDYLGWDKRIANKTIDLLERIAIARDILFDTTKTITPVLENVSSDDFHGDRMLEIEKLEKVLERVQEGVWQMLDTYVPGFPALAGRLKPARVITPEDDGISQQDANFLKGLPLDQALTVANAMLGSVYAVASFKDGDGETHRYLHIAASGQDLMSISPVLMDQDPLSSTVTGRGLAWTIVGSALDDTIIRVFSDASTYFMGAGKDSVVAGYGDDAIHGRSGDDHLNGGGGNDAIDGGTGEDQIVGGVGNDTLVGGAGADSLDGDVGTDTASYANAPGRVVVQLLTPENNQGEAAGDTFVSIESIIGSQFDDGLVGTGGTNRLDGGAGADRIFGVDGNDTLIGGAGADYLSGGVGTDTASYANAPGRVVAQLLTPANNQGEAAGDTYNSIESIIGSRFDDGLVGTGGTNRLDGGAGADRIFGVDGNDTLIGGAGADYLSGGVGTDTASYANAKKAIIVSLANPAINRGDAAGDTFNSVENLIGSAFDDTLNGNSAGNVIDGGAGADSIKGYAGNDKLTGGAGKDNFIFNMALSAASNVDKITDFSVTDDTIRLDNLIFAKLAVTGALPSGYFRANATGAAQDANDHILYETDTGKLFYDADGNKAGGTAGIHFATLSAGLALTSADFVVI